MADYYQEFCCALGNLSEEELTWWREKLTPQEPPESLEGEDLKKWENEFEDTNSMDWMVWPGFQWEEEYDADNTHLVFTDDGGVVYLGVLANLMQEFLEKFSPEKCFALEWSNTCSRHRLDGFGGGAAIITTKGVEWMNSGSWLDKKLKDFGVEGRNLHA